MEGAGFFAGAAFGGKGFFADTAFGGKDFFAGTAFGGAALGAAAFGDAAAADAGFWAACAGAPCSNGPRWMGAGAANIQLAATSNAAEEHNFTKPGFCITPLVSHNQPRDTSRNCAQCVH